MRWATALAGFVVSLWVSASSCNHGTPTAPSLPTPTPRPTPTPTPTPTLTPSYPPGIPHATAFANLVHVTALERQVSQDGYLAQVEGFGTALDGRIAGGSGWAYTFVEREGTFERTWVVRENGEIYVLEFDPGLSKFEYPGIEADLFIDSPEAIQRALDAGVSPFAAKHPDAHVEVTYRRKFGLTICEMRFYDASFVDPCQPTVIIDAMTGEVVFTYLDCLNPPAGSSAKAPSLTLKNWLGVGRGQR